MASSRKRPSFIAPAGSDLAIRCLDVVVNLNGRQVGEFEQLVIAGMAARLALHLRGAPVMPYDTLRVAALHLLQIPPTALRSVLEFLAEIEFVRLDTQGGTIRAVVPTVPYYEDMFGGIGESVETKGLSEAEQLTAVLVHRLAMGPMAKERLNETGVEKKLVRRMTDVGEQGGYFISRRARGRDIIISPVSRDQAVVLKFAMLVLEYLCAATAVPREFNTQLGALLVTLQGELLESSRRAGSGERKSTPEPRLETKDPLGPLFRKE